MKHFYSAAVVLLFAFFALASKVNKLHMNAFQYYNIVEERYLDGTYLVTNSGEKIHGEKIDWKTGLLVKNQISIDDQVFKISEIKGYREGKFYYARQGAEYVKRIVRGKINVYVKFQDVSTTSTTLSGGMRSHSYTSTQHYSQKGEDGPLVPFANQNDIKKIVEDCPKAYEMANLSDKEMKKAIKKQPYYLNNIFNLYNRGCN